LRESIEYFAQIFAISLCAWGLFGLYLILSIKRFIVKRYEKETDLGRTVFFIRHMPFAKYVPAFFSSSLYCGHLLAFIWGWKIIKFIKEKRKGVTYFDDIDSPEFVTSNFSVKEIRRVKMVAVISLILFSHGVAFLIFRSIWPEVFSR
jgi:hypothetical protein